MRRGEGGKGRGGGEEGREKQKNYLQNYRRPVQMRKQEVVVG